MTFDRAPTHRRLAEIGLRAEGPHGFALAGGHAIAAHGILQRPGEDVDLFTDWQRRAAEDGVKPGEVVGLQARVDGWRQQLSGDGEASSL